MRRQQRRPDAAASGGGPSGGAAFPLFTLFLLATSCLAGPKYSPETVIAPAQRVGAPRLSDSSRQFFESLEIERRRDSIRSIAPVNARQTIDDRSVDAAAWLDIIPDSNLVRLVDVALRENRDLRVAVARMDEYRANLGVARASQLPSVNVNASESSNQVALGAFPATSYQTVSSGARSGI